MLKRFLPKDYKRSIFEITPEYLQERNIKGIITDLDNTLVEWYKRMQKNGISVMIVSNNKKKRLFLNNGFSLIFIYYTFISNGQMDPLMIKATEASAMRMSP